MWQPWGFLLEFILPRFTFFALLSLLSLSLTFTVCIIANRLGFISRPVENRWNERTVSLGGGIAIHLAVIVGILLVRSGIPLTFLPSFLVVFGLGLLDDIWGISPPGKLVTQALAASLVITQGFLFPLSWPVVSIAITIIWIVGMSNAVNLLDNMDGLAAGFSLIAALALSILLEQQGDGAHSKLALAVAAGAGGFLILNFHPARIFMGDAGSLPLGFALAVLATKVRFQGEISNSFILVPVMLLLIVPIFDTILVMIARQSAKRPLMSGGRDHTSHRLVALGLNERKSTLILYLFSVVGCFAAMSVLKGTPTSLTVTSVVSMMALALLCVFLLEIVVYPAAAHDIFTSHKNPRRVVYGVNSLPMPALYLVELAVDVCAFSLAWTLAHLLRFYDESLVAHYKMASVIPSLPFLLTTKLFAFSVFRLYRGVWRTIMTRDVYMIFKAAGLGTLLLIGGLAFTSRLQDISRVVILLDFLLTFTLTLGIRAAMMAFRRWSRRLADQPYRAALLGPRGISEAVQSALQLEPSILFSGVISTDPVTDSDPLVLGEASNLEQVVEKHKIDVLLIGSEKFNDLVSTVAAKGVIVRLIRVVLA